MVVCGQQIESMSEHQDMPGAPFLEAVAGTYKKERVLAGKPYFSVASGGGTGRTLHPDNMAAGPASYGMTDTLGRHLPNSFMGKDAFLSG